MITHYDLFSGIGGFSLALEEVFSDEEIKHIFCEWEQFPAAVLKKHWPNGTYYGDIADLVADTTSKRRENSRNNSEGRHAISNETHEDETQGLKILTGGFPCQPFSHAGRRKGTADDRYQWPNMFEVIRNVKPDWVIAENVRGLVTWNEGMVLEQVCTDLESEGYEVQPFIIPAVAVNAPHRRDRVWIIANRNRSQTDTKRQESRGFGERRWNTMEARAETSRQTDWEDGDNQHERHSKTTPDARSQRRSSGSGEGIRSEGQKSKRSHREYPDWQRDWREVAFATCYDGVDDGLPRRLDGATLRGKRTDQISASKHRQERLKAMGNAIVPQVAMEIFRGIRSTR